MRKLLGVQQKKQDRLFFNNACQTHGVNPHLVKEDMQAQGYKTFTPGEVTNFILNNY
tara:strand:- start:344 stop:514 length:171 start_codon:yes stop_codon:yes gene_type:complete